MSTQELITNHLDLWTGAVTNKRGTGRSASSKNGNVEFTGIKKLSELILELAVRGKLVEQDPSDEPASVLLDRIAEEKARLVKEGKIKKGRPLPEIEEEKKYYILPDSWQWVMLGEIQTFTNGFAFKSKDFSNHGTGVIRIGDVSRDGRVKPDDMKLIPKEVSETIGEQFFVNPGDLVITMTGDVKPGINYTESSYLLNQRVGKVTPHVVSKGFLFVYLKTVAKEKIENAFGGVIPNVSTKDMNESVIGLPPLNEQHRIVEKVDELMALCDRLEQQVGDQLEAHEVLVDTLLDALTRSEDAGELAENWARVAEHFDTLFTTEDSIDKLKKTILQLAVMGRLVEQDPNDDPVSALLERIAEEKAQLVKDGKIKKSKKLPFPEDQDKIFPLPDGWEWASIASTGITSTGKTPSTKEKLFFDGEIPFIGPGQITTSGHINQPDKFLSENGLLESEEALPNDIIVVCIGGSIGKCAKIHKRCGFNQQINKVRPILVHPDYLLSTLSTDFVHELILGKSTGSATPIINRSKWEEIFIPLPPINEQHRIAEKVNELMALCDQLKTRLSESGKTRAQLAETVVEQAVS